MKLEPMEPNLSRRAMQRLQGLVEDFRTHVLARADRELEYFARMPSLDLAIHYAGLATSESGKRFSHQRRLPRAVLVRATNALKGTRQGIAGCSAFDALHEHLTRTVGKHHGIGALYLYDTALRIGAYLKLAPDLVYLHAGVRQGAKALGLPIRQTYLRVEELPTPLQSLRPDDIEDFLCIYKKQLVALDTPLVRRPGVACGNRREAPPTRHGC